MTFQTLQLAHEAGIATITLNRPDKRNAVSFQLVDELLAALDEIEKSDSHVAIITGAGKAFCAGMDLDELNGLLGKTHDENVKDSAHMAAMFRRLYEFTKPTITAVNSAMPAKPEKTNAFTRSGDSTSALTSSSVAPRSTGWSAESS